MCMLATRALVYYEMLTYYFVLESRYLQTWPGAALARSEIMRVHDVVHESLTVDLGPRKADLRLILKIGQGPLL